MTLYQKYKAKGICPSCKSRPIKEGISICEVCYAKRQTPDRKTKQKAAIQKYKSLHKELGLCSRCHNNVIPGQTECLECSQKAQAKRKFKKLEIFALYGGKCACCNEDTYEFLTIDHVNGGGNQHRKQGFKHRNIENFLIDGKPNPAYQVLCMNCNFAKGMYGYCPHKHNHNG